MSTILSLCLVVATAHLCAGNAGSTGYNSDSNVPAEAYGPPEQGFPLQPPAVFTEPTSKIAIGETAAKPRESAFSALKQNFVNTWSRRLDLKTGLNFLYDKVGPLWGKPNQSKNILGSIDMSEPAPSASSPTYSYSSGPSSRHSPPPSTYSYRPAPYSPPSSSYPYASSSYSHPSYSAPSSYAAPPSYSAPTSYAPPPSYAAPPTSPYSSPYAPPQPTYSRPATSPYAAPSSPYASHAPSPYYPGYSSYRPPTYPSSYGPPPSGPPKPAASSPYPSYSRYPPSPYRPLYPPPPVPYGAYPSPTSHYPSYALPPPNYQASASETKETVDKSAITIGGIGNIMSILGKVSFDGKNIKFNTANLAPSTSSKPNGPSPFIQIGELGKISLNPSSNGVSISFSKE